MDCLASHGFAWKECSGPAAGVTWRCFVLPHGKCPLSPVFSLSKNCIERLIVPVAKEKLTEAVAAAKLLEKHVSTRPSVMSNARILNYWMTRLPCATPNPNLNVWCRMGKGRSGGIGSR